ncbi:MAG: hypothetical protein KXJ49_08550 [Vulcanococcus sp.]|uniref:hypothetical protein n=1 Tax=Vulcanococcus sp. TaxID=2856995 RepID=UPI0025EBC089|nr:hypothetical protein [Vulcanococcus sp.]MBW0167534.1 hypothetical protein [Vulcanococcus sp.]
METTDTQDYNPGDGTHLLRSPANAERLRRALNRAQEQTSPPTDLDELEAQLQLSHTWLTRSSDLLENYTNGSFAPLFDALDRSEPVQGHD